MKPTIKSRRGFLSGVTGVVAAAAAQSAPSTSVKPIIWSSLLRTCVHPALRDPGNARRLGRHYLALHPLEEDAAAISETLFGSQIELVWGRPDYDLEKRFERRVHDDYRFHRTDIVDGWIISRSEAQLCALLCMTTYNCVSASAETAGGAY